ncbi:Hsp20 family protein [Komagataeibacter swingsii]|uniref:Heat-shock protein n=1 Tax=Komagataeibacter swingsii TaxID=215220 RepID=A0A2V4RLB3_9PROT|nr:Hsp20 family protein [Komagataeibacter swingsii]PYD69774.1 heat-shock protein [Komagataeibacter swingsii]GBQ55310.1 heat shock protein Hsp20 [Komagataeibacter swingsii DSM 16373]
MAYDFAPLFRSAIGFDRLAQLVDTAAQNPVGSSYPPYNIEKLSDAQYALTMAVAGFGPDDIELTVQDNTLIVSGRVSDAAPGGREMLYRGIATRAFERRFVLADHVVVEKADLTNGLLRIAVRQIVPEALKPRRIPISSGQAMAGDTVPGGEASPATDGLAMPVAAGTAVSPAPQPTSYAA